MTNILLILSIIATIICYLIIIISKLTSKNNAKEKASETVIRLTSDDNSLHLVENKNALFNKYQIKRKIIKLTPKSYISTSYFDISIAYLFSGYSKLNNKKLDLIGKIVPYFYYISFTPILSIIISFIVKTSMDAKIGIIFLLIIALYQYLIYEQNIEAVTKIKVEEKAVESKLRELLLISKLFFIITLIQIFRIILFI